MAIDSSRMAAAALGFSAFAVLAACGTTTEEAPTTDAPSSPSEGSSSGGSSSNGSSSGEGNDGGSPSEDAATTADAGGDTPDAEAGAPVAARFDPVPKVGQTWTYQITGSNLASVPNGTRTATVTAMGSFVSRDQAFTITDAFGVPQKPFYWHALGAEGTEQYDPNQPSPVWTPVLDDPPLPGHTWTVSAGVTFTSSPLASATVPAGTFTDCVQIARTPGTIRLSYCRGIGLVQQEVSYNGSTFLARLSARSP